jgi:putative glutamine amidotransferase
MRAQKRPLIGVSYGSPDAEGWQAKAEPYLGALLAAGARPLPLPAGLDGERLAAKLGELQGLLMCGGPDVDPRLYGEQAQGLSGPADHRRDQDEIALVMAAVPAGLPVLAICRGVQILNVALGGTLYQDLRSQVPRALPHPSKERQQPVDRGAVVHAVSIQSASLLAGCLAGEEAQVNSLHHQAAKDVAPGLQAVAWAPDGVIEALEMPGRRFVVGVQWHPEEMTGTSQQARSLFSCLVEAAARYAMGPAL